MTKIDTFTLKNVDPVIEDIKKALADISDKYGITMGIAGKVGVGENGNMIRFKVEAAANSDGISAREAILKENLATYSNLTGIGLEHFGSEISSNKYGMCKLIGYDPKSPKYPFLAKNNKGQTIKFTVNTVKIQLLGISHDKLTKRPAPKKISESRQNMNDNEKSLFVIIQSLVKFGGSTTMDKVLSKVHNDYPNMKDTSAMVYVGNLKKKGYITRDSKKNIFVVL